MRLRNLYGPHRLAMLGVALVVLSVAVFTLTAALAHLRSPGGRGGVQPLHVGPSGERLPAESPWRVDEGKWSADEGGYRASGAGASLVADAPGADLQLSFKLTMGLSQAFPIVFVRESDEGGGYRLSPTDDGRLSLARSADGKSSVVATSAQPISTNDKDTDFKVEVTGARLRAWLNGTVVIDYVDPEPLSGGQVRIRALDDSLRLSSLSLVPLTP